MALKEEKCHSALKYQEIPGVMEISAAAGGKRVSLCQLNSCFLDDLINLGPVQGEHPSKRPQFKAYLECRDLHFLP